MQKSGIKLERKLQLTHIKVVGLFLFSFYLFTYVKSSTIESQINKKISQNHKTRIDRQNLSIKTE